MSLDELIPLLVSVFIEPEAGAPDGRALLRLARVIDEAGHAATIGPMRGCGGICALGSTIRCSRRASTARPLMMSNLGAGDVDPRAELTRYRSGGGYRGGGHLRR